MSILKVLASAALIDRADISMMVPYTPYSLFTLCTSNAMCQSELPLYSGQVGSFRDAAEAGPNSMTRGIFTALKNYLSLSPEQYDLQGRLHLPAHHTGLFGSGIPDTVYIVIVCSVSYIGIRR